MPLLWCMLPLHWLLRDEWIGNYSSNGVPDMQAAFSSVFGQGLLIIVGSFGSVPYRANCGCNGIP